MWHQKEKGYSPFPETFPWEKLQHTRVNILDLKILQVFFKNRGEILVLEISITQRMNPNKID